MAEQNFIFITTEVGYSWVEDRAIEKGMTTAQFVSEALRAFAEASDSEQVESEPQKTVVAAGRKRFFNGR